VPFSNAVQADNAKRSINEPCPDTFQLLKCPFFSEVKNVCLHFPMQISNGESGPALSDLLKCAAPIAAKRPNIYKPGWLVSRK